MKKLPLFLSINFLALTAGVLGGCSSEKKIDIPYGDLHASLVSLSFGELKEKVDSKNSFMLVVQYSDGCACWTSEAKPTIEKFIAQKHVPVYHIKKDELDANKNRFNLTIITGNVTFAVFEDGVAAKQVTTHDDTTLKKYSEFESYINSIVNMPRMYYVSLDDVDKLYRADEKNIIYFSRSTCGDCSYLDSHYLITWSKNHPEYKKTIFILDCDQPEIRLDDEGNVNAEQWQTFKDDYGLSNKHNPVYGYNTGYVPTFLYINGALTGAQYLSGCVVFNDTVVEQDGKCVVTDSYYTSERLGSLTYLDSSVQTRILKGKTLGSKDVTVYPEYGNYVAWNHESAEQYHNIFVEKFLDYCEKN